MRKCTADGCGGELLYDGYDQCVLNMKVFCIAYEVLYNYMFHFFHARYYNQNNHK